MPTPSKIYDIPLKVKKEISKQELYSLVKTNNMTSRQRLHFAFFFMTGIVLTIIFGVWWFNPQHIPHNFNHLEHILDYAFFVILSYIVWHSIVMELFAWYIASSVSIPVNILPPEEGLRVAYLTAFVPGIESYDILEKTLKAMVKVDYPHDTWLLDEGNDEEAKRICREIGVGHYSRKDREEFNTSSGKFAKKTKGGNYNSWLHHHDNDYDIIAQHDVDFIPRKDFLTRILGYFRDPKVAFVGTPQIYGNTDESWIVQGAAEQTYGFYGYMQKGFFGHDMTLLIGANHIFRVKALQDIDGYKAHITEDLLTGMTIYGHRNKWKSVYVPEVLLVGEGPATWGGYLNQQMRWAYGCIDVLFRHTPKLLPKMNFRKLFNYFVLQQFYFSGVAQTAGIILICLYFFGGISAASMTLVPIFILYVPLLIFQVLFQLWLQRFNVVPEKERGLFMRSRLLTIAVWPTYFLAFIGVLRGKKLSYVVTPKGGTQEADYVPALFIPHFILGTITLAALIFGFIAHRMSGILIFWATVNTIFMYYFFFSEFIPYADNIKLW